MIEGVKGHLSPTQWTTVILLAGIGTVLEWFDFYIFSMLNATLEAVFFPVANETIKALSFWGVFAAAFVVRPVGAIIFGHIGDTIGRNRCLIISIVIMASATIVIGALPTFNFGRYKAGVAAPVLLVLFRIIQGLAMGGEYGSAIVYISELAQPSKRGQYVATLLLCPHIGMFLATFLVMILQNTMTADQLTAFGWRVPFLFAFLTSVLGFVLRRNMPEPHAFLEAARREKALQAAAAAAAAGGASYDEGVEAEIASPCAADKKASNAEAGAAAAPDEDEEESRGHDQERGRLSKLQGKSHSKVPIVRVLRNNYMGLIIQICFMAWVSAAIYTMVSWLVKDMRSYGFKQLEIQGIFIVGMTFNALGLVAFGLLIDRGMRTLWSKAILAVVGVAVGFLAFSPVGIRSSRVAAWTLTPLFQVIIGASMANVALPCTRIYDPLERTTGFSFGFNIGYGIVGGITPLVVSSIKAGLPAAAKCYAPAVWLAVLGSATVLGCVMLRAYMPRLGKPYVGKME